ncbi:MAG: mobile mystery protein B [Bacteroidetes bacterium]|nr:mobile mystery protein B [Bacteroidota bacterium]
MGLKFEMHEDGQTPLDEDEKEGLLFPWISTKGELDEAEQANINKAFLWVAERRKKFNAAEVITENFVRNLHKKMFGDIWAWAGEYRVTNKNIGVDKYQIGISLKQLIDDCNFWIEYKTFPEDEIAIRFSHRIVAIHCFPNGNGRHSRLMADIIIEKIFSREVFSWGTKNLIKAGEERAAYLKAIREADTGNYSLLLDFARA